MGLVYEALVVREQCGPNLVQASCYSSLLNCNICSSSRCCVLFPGLRHLLVTIGVSSPTSPLSSVTFLLPLPARAVEAQNLKFSSSCSSSSPPGFCISRSLQLSSDKCQVHLPDLFPRLITRHLYYALRRTQHTEIYFRFL